MTVLNSGGGTTVQSQGTWAETGHLKFHHRGTAKFSDGRTCGVEFDKKVISDSDSAWSKTPG